MQIGFTVDVQGRPICGELWPGNTADVTTLKPVVDLREITVMAEQPRRCANCCVLFGPIRACVGQAIALIIRLLKLGTRPG